MRERRTFGRTLRWTWAIVAGVLFHVSLYWGVALTRDSGQKLRRQDRQFTEVHYLDTKTADQSEVLTQQMTLFDPRPLLLPTQWNAANSARLVNQPEEAEIFPEFSPMFESEDGNYIEEFGNVPALYDRLSVAQGDFGFQPFREIGRRDTENFYVKSPGMSVSIKDPSSGAELNRILIYSEEVAKLDLDWPARRPATLLATVEKGFQVGGLAVVVSSGFDDADRELASIAYANFLRLGQLDDGVYLLEIVP